MKPWVDANPDIAKRFVEASIIGWSSYLYAANAAANALIKIDNPEMTDDQIAYGIAKLKEYGIVVSGDAETKGIGCMTNAGWSDYYHSRFEVGVFEADLDISQAYSTTNVCHGLGLDLMQ